MKAPFGKRNKNPEDNADCFLNTVNDHISSLKSGKFNKKNEKKMQKYIERMYDIVIGKSDKWKNNYVSDQ